MNMNKGKLAVMAAVMAGLMVTMAGCGGSSDSAEKGKVLKVGTEPTFAPFEFSQEDKKEYVGFDIDLTKAVAKQMGAEVEIQGMGFDGLIPALKSGTIDVAVAGMSITDERKQQITFSDPYYTSGLVVVVRSENQDIHGIEDLKGKKVCVQLATTGADKAAEIPDVQIATYNSSADQFMELTAGSAEAAIVDKPVADYYIAQGGGAGKVKIVGDKMTADDFGFAFKKDSKLAADWNKAMAEVKKSGEYDKIYAKWFGEAK